MEDLKTTKGILEYLGYIRKQEENKINRISEEPLASCVERIEDIHCSNIIYKHFHWLTNIDENDPVGRVLNYIEERFKLMIKDLLVFNRWHEKCTDQTRNLMAIYGSNATVEILKYYAIILNKNDISVDVIPILALGF